MRNVDREKKIVDRCISEHLGRGDDMRRYGVIRREWGGFRGYTLHAIENR
jgi:hypothetical protein